MTKKTAAKKKVAKKKASKKKAASKNKGGRPTKSVNLDTLVALAGIQCTAEECASVLGVSPDTIDRRLKAAGFGGFADFYKQHSDDGKVSLRRAQFRVALGGNPTMLIWLGKQVLGQRDKQDIEHDASDPIKELLAQIAGSASVLDQARSRTKGDDDETT